MRVVSDTPHVSLSLDLLIFSSLPQMKGNVDHQTPDFNRTGTLDKGHNGKAYDGDHSRKVPHSLIV